MFKTGMGWEANRHAGFQPVDNLKRYKTSIKRRVSPSRALRFPPDVRNPLNAGSGIPNSPPGERCRAKETTVDFYAVFQAGAEGLGVTNTLLSVCNLTRSERAVYTVFFSEHFLYVPLRSRTKMEVICSC